MPEKFNPALVDSTKHTHDPTPMLRAKWGTRLTHPCSFLAVGSDSHVSYYLQQIFPERSLSRSLFIWLPNGMESPAPDIFGKRGRHMELTSLESPIRLHNSRTLDPSTLQKPTFMQTSKQTNSPSKAQATSSLVYFLHCRCVHLNSWCVLAYSPPSTLLVWLSC